MGSERKIKETKHRKRTTSSSDSEDEGRRRRKRHKSVEGEEDEERKSNKKSSHKHSSKHRSHKDKEKKSRDKDKVKHQKGDPEPTYEFHEISKDDYFSKNNEFSTWLKEKKKVFFSDLSADSAREMFTDFVKAWNRRKLESRYYEGAIVSAPRSAHKWKIRA